MYVEMAVAGIVRQSGNQTISQRFGVRQVGTADGRVTLNGKPVYLKGVNRHEAHYEFGVTTPVQLMYEDVQNLKDLGGNFIRGSHYAQCDQFLQVCDELGVLVWEESLGWGNKPQQLKDPEIVTASSGVGSKLCASRPGESRSVTSARSPTMARAKS